MFEFETLLSFSPKINVPLFIIVVSACIEFFDDEVDSIRYFDVDSQTSVGKSDKAEILRQIDIVNSLPIDILKLHQLQITKGTILEHRSDLITQCTLFTPEDYIEKSHLEQETDPEPNDDALPGTRSVVI